MCAGLPQALQKPDGLKSVEWSASEDFAHAAAQFVPLRLDGKVQQACDDVASLVSGAADDPGERAKVVLLYSFTDAHDCCQQALAKHGLAFVCGPAAICGKRCANAIVRMKSVTPVCVPNLAHGFDA